MNEKLLQYIWNFKIFNNFDFIDINGNSVEVLDFGQWNYNSGPDFLIAKIKTNNLVLIGNIELHVRSSDWIFHKHSSDSAFDNLILHVVFENDIEVDELQARNIQTLELKNYINKTVLETYSKFLNNENFIACEGIFKYKSIPLGFHEENILKKLDEKSIEIENSLIKFKNNYEAVLFHLLAYTFGLKINAQIFRELAENIDFNVVLKVKQNRNQLEALLLGKANLLNNPEDNQSLYWKKEYDFLTVKFNLAALKFPTKFLRLRPQNFPTIRLSQLAHLYHREQNLFSKIIKAKTTEEFFVLFYGIKASEYWNSHFVLGKLTEKNQPKFLTKDFVEIILMNAILPLKYAYHKNSDEEIVEEIIKIYKSLNPEKNSIIENWKNLGVEIASSLESQSLLYHYSTFCTPKKCLNCSIGFRLLK